MKTLQICLLVLSVHLAFSTTGFDISMYQGAISQDGFSCMINNGYGFAIIQAWCGGYGINSDFPQNIENAKNAGIPYVDVYVFACPYCNNNQDTDSIMSQVAQNLPGDFNGMLWLDIEECTGCWSGDGTDNLNYVNSLAVSAQNAGFRIGVYSSLYEWSTVTGGQYAQTSLLNSLPLWYAHYDGSADYNDSEYYHFGGWTSPAIKQFSDNGGACGFGYDSDWYP